MHTVIYIYIYIYIYILYIYIYIYICHRHQKLDMKDMEWFMCGGVRETGLGCQQMSRHVGMILLHMCKGFPTQSAEADDSDIT